MKIIRLTSTSSTNQIAKDLITKGECETPTVIVAAEQISGKGQYDRVFSSPKGGLYFSLIVKPGLHSKALPMVTLATGLGCAELLAEMLQKPIFLKWPNDIYVSERKICGILCESVILDRAQEAQVVIGLGLNVNSRLLDFPKQLQGTVTTIREESGGVIDLDTLFAQVLEKIKVNIGKLKENSTLLLEKWQQYDYLYNRKIFYDSGKRTITGTGLGITAHGGYTICDQQGDHHEIIGGQLRLKR